MYFLRILHNRSFSTLSKSFDTVIFKGKTENSKLNALGDLIEESAITFMAFLNTIFFLLALFEYMCLFVQSCKGHDTNCCIISFLVLIFK